MSKKRLNISEEGVNEIIENYANIIEIKCLNEKNKQMRYFLEKDGNKFCIDVFFAKDKTINPCKVGKDDCQGFSNKLVEIIKESDKYKLKERVCYTCKIELNIFNELIEYLCGIKGISKIKDEDKEMNGRVVTIINENGDKVTLTHYKSNDNMMYQGHLMDLYVEVKSFITPFIKEKINLKNEDINRKGIEEFLSNVDIFEYIDIHLKSSYKLLPSIIQGLVEDSFILIKSNNKLSEYSSCTMPILKVLEYRTKEMWGHVGISIDDSKGFMHEYKKDRWDYLYFMNKGSIVINGNIERKLNLLKRGYSDNLINCYEYWKNNRHGLFHTKQIAEGSRIIKTKEEAMNIILESCKLIENSYVELGK